VCLPDAGHYQVSVELKISVQRILRLLQLNLVEIRDLLALLRGNIPDPKQTAIRQMALL